MNSIFVGKKLPTPVITYSAVTLSITLSGKFLTKLMMSCGFNFIGYNFSSTSGVSQQQYAVDMYRKA